MRISDWSSDVCSSDLANRIDIAAMVARDRSRGGKPRRGQRLFPRQRARDLLVDAVDADIQPVRHHIAEPHPDIAVKAKALALHMRSEEHTSELQSLMRISYAVFCLQKKKNIYKQ